MKFILPKISLIIALLLLVVSSFVAIGFFGVNTPHWDDNAIRFFVQDFSISHFFDLFKLHNEHRIFFTRVVALKLNWLFGELNFKHMMFVGQVPLIGVLGWFIFLARRWSFPPITWLVPALLIFNASTFENSLWAMASVQNHTVIFWAMTSLILLCIRGNNKWMFPVAVLAGIMGLLTSANALVIIPTALLVLFFEKRKKAFWIYLGIHIIVVALYFQNFTDTHESSRPHLERFFLNLSTLGGSLIYPFLNRPYTIHIATAAGGLLLAYSIWIFFKLLFRKGDQEKLISFIALNCFFWGTLVLVALGRNEYDRTLLLSSKYKMYSFLIFGTNLLFSIKKNGENITKKNFSLGLIMVVGLYINAQLSFLDDLRFTYWDRVADHLNLVNQYGPQKGVYNSPVFAFQKQKALPGDLELIADRTDTENKTIIDLKPSDTNGNKLLMIQQGDFKKVIPFQHRYLFFVPLPEVSAEILRYELPTGEYQASIMTTSDKQLKSYTLPEPILLTNAAYTAPKKNW